MHGRWLWLAFCLFASMAGGAPARATDTPCKTPEIHRLAVPLDYQDPNSRTFDLAFRLREGSGPVRPLVIVLPGGPGATLMREDTEVTSGGIPSEFPVVLTDPRGAGCNDDAALTEDRYFSSETLARDVLAIVRALAAERRLSSGYILYGQSYGTVEATIAAALAARSGAPQPRALVLEGTLGHSFANYDDYFAPFQAEWRNLRGKLPEPWRQRFQDGTFTELSHGDSIAWAHLIEHELLNGFLPNGDEALEQLLAQKHALLRMLLGPFAARFSEGQTSLSPLMRVIACGELTGNLYAGRDLVSGELVLRGRNECAGTGALTHPYDAAQWPLTMPLVYVQGQHDPATPPAQARYHFDVQRRAPRWLLSVGRAGHEPLGISLAAGDCRAQLWHAIAADLDRLPAVVEACNVELQADITLVHRDAEPVPPTAGFGD